MLYSQSFKPTPSNSNPSTGSWIRISLICLLAALTFCLAAATVQPARASSGSLSTGQVTNQTTVTCPSRRDARSDPAFTLVFGPRTIA
jgi:hypothetical protein